MFLELGPLCLQILEVLELTEVWGIYTNTARPSALPAVWNYKCRFKLLA